MLYGLAIQAADGATAEQLREVVDVALRAFPRPAKAKRPSRGA